MAKNPKDMELKDFDTKWFVGVSFNNFTHPILKGVKINWLIKIFSSSSSLKVSKNTEIKDQCDYC